LLHAGHPLLLHATRLPPLLLLLLLQFIRLLLLLFLPPCLRLHMRLRASIYPSFLLLAALFPGVNATVTASFVNTFKVIEPEQCGYVA
jgi:hypothetical protein